MKFSESWLREWVNPAIETTELVAQLTMAGLEVDAVEPVAPPFSGVVVGEIIAVEPHPNADKLRVCQVAGGPDGEVQVVCGAPNARAGLKIPFATVGAQLPNDMKIRKAKLRDVESFGMLCGEDELGLGDNGEGLFELPAGAPVGADLRGYLGLNDQLIEVDLTPNRGDCLSLRGLARETGVLNSHPVTSPDLTPVSASIEDVLPVELQAPSSCPRYAGRVIRGINIKAESPLWLQEKLRRSGLRSIDPVVDVTNYVMLELGQPMHAFDLSTLQGGIVVRMAEQGEKLKLLDGSEATLNSDTLLISDREKPLAIAGIMGGEDSSVNSETVDIFLESAYFDPIAIAGRPRNYGLHTDSSHRFERGVDPQLQAAAIERATALLVDIVGGQPGPVVSEASPAHLPATPEVVLTSAKLKQQLALDLEAGVVREMLERLGLDVIAENDQGWTCVVPSWRFDIAIEMDLIEEVARIYGYNRLPTTTISAHLPIAGGDEKNISLSLLRQQLTAKGYREAISYCFVDPEVQKHLSPGQESVVLANPIASDMSVMRTTLWSGLLPAVRRNLNRQQSRVRIFETGLRFVPDGGQLQQQPMIAGAITGARQPERWSNSQENVDFFDIKADVDALLQQAGSYGEYRYVVEKNHPALHPGQAARIEREGRLVGYVGRIHPRVQKGLDLSQPVYVFELLSAEVLAGQLPAFGGISKFPEVRRDLALIVDQDVSAEALSMAVRQNAGSYLIDLKIFDVYQGKGIEKNRKSVGMGLTFRDSSRTLTEEEINGAVEDVVNAMKEQFSASLRG
ncbi:phenylalanine--tRNA ligase subunit beta [Porticoccus litoralis]|uniref:Phenylalanine--tRNA ligase beta subunit n=1 Tax=Porticoccus litoralis TaxID=434086 RepID=A0AAW8B1P9_9GAMM|nr:phenylalanine--tRNA ligase subunit beta [Porticoccus litoralis]MDP1519702.1 phenylalanine--tRNA ligase subunit beta [Porticoccus litoralis]